MASSRPSLLVPRSHGDGSRSAPRPSSPPPPSRPASDVGPTAPSHPQGPSASVVAPLATLGGRSRARATNKNAILVSERQRGNPVLQYVRNVPWEFADIVPDYELGDACCALYLSLRYALLHPRYLHIRMAQVEKKYTVRVLLVHVDLSDVQRPLEQVTKAAFVNQWTLVCAWSNEEAARYLETFKSYENKPADLIKGRADEADPKQVFARSLLRIKPVNKTDVATLAASFGSIARIAASSIEELALCPGLGEKKVRRIYDAFRQSLVPGAAVASGSRSSSSSSAASKRQRTTSATGAEDEVDEDENEDEDEENGAAL